MLKTIPRVNDVMPYLQVGILVLACVAWPSQGYASDEVDNPLSRVPGESPVTPVACGTSAEIPPDLAPPAREKVNRSNPCGPVVYENSGQSGSWVATGDGGRVADDCTLAWYERGVCAISTLVVNANTETATVVLELWDGCPYDGGTLLRASDPFDLTPYAFNDVTWNLGTELPVGNTAWVAWTSSDDDVGPVLSGLAEIGYTADVFATNDCVGGEPSCECHFLGGSPYAGFDVTISAVEVPSACCLPDGTCVDLLYADCAAEAGTWYIGAYCENFSCPPDCPDDTLYGQPIVVPTDAWGGYTSDDAPDVGFLVYDNFSGLTAPICDIHFWGFQAYHDETTGWEACTETPMKFEIKFYADDAGAPGTEVCSYTVTLLGTDTGLVYDGLPLYEFGAVFESCCDLAEGWVSIQGIGEVDDCWFLWMNAYGPGDGAFQHDGSTLNPIEDDLAFCLTGASLSLIPDKTCYAVGEPIIVDVFMSDVSDVIRGGQFFIAYDETKLDLASVAPGDAPFTQEVFECSDLVTTPTPFCTPTTGLIDYAVGVPDGDPGITGSRVMARVTFTALEELCHVADLVSWREHSPPTRLSDQYGLSVLPIKANLPTISVDETAPVISGLTLSAEDGLVDAACEQAIAFSATVTDTCCLAAGAVTVDVTLPTANAILSDILIYVDQISVTEVSISGSALVSSLVDCPATVQVTIHANDCCGNPADPAMADVDVFDTIPPVFTFEPEDLTVECDGHGNLEELDAWLATATAGDNCGGVTITSDVDDLSDECGETGSALVTWTATDGCGNTVTHTATFMIEDTTAPIITCPTDVTIECDASTDPADTGTPGHFQGFEHPAYVSGLYHDWNEYNSLLVRAVTGTDGITSATGSAHAVIDSTSTASGETGVFSRLGGYDSTFDESFVVSLDVYVDLDDPAVTASPDTYGWDLSTAVSNQSGGHRRDFIFHTASNDAGHVLVAGSNNTNFERREDLAGLNHHAITTTGWYTFQWVFRNAGDGSLAGDLNLLDSAGGHLWTETLNNPSDDIATIVGGHRYMWFTFLAVDKLAIDNTAVFDSLSATDACDVAPVISYTDDTSGLTGCNGTGTLIRTWTAMDACGNAASCDQIITVEDTTPPEITSCPADITVLADAGDCSAAVEFGGAEASDSCDMDPTAPITYWIGTTQITSPHVFPGGDTLVTVKAMDACGNINDTCTFQVTVTPYSELRIAVELSPAMEDPAPGTPGDTLTRCITFELWTCSPLSGPVVFEEEVVFSVDAGEAHLGEAILTDVPCGEHSCITARDRLHTLRRTADIEIPAGETYFFADFTGADRLVGGDLNDDGWIDIIDFGVYSWQYTISYGSGDTGCLTDYPHADINGDGLVETADFSFIQTNFLMGREDNCCGQPRLLSHADTRLGPLTEVSVAELRAFGLDHLIAADLNDDGKLDQMDIAAFMLGDRPDSSGKPGWEMNKVNNRSSR